MTWHGGGSPAEPSRKQHGVPPSSFAASLAADLYISLRRRITRGMSTGRPLANRNCRSPLGRPHPAPGRDRKPFTRMRSEGEGGGAAGHEGGEEDAVWPCMCCLAAAAAASLAACAWMSAWCAVTWEGVCEPAPALAPAVLPVPVPVPAGAGMSNSASKGRRQSACLMPKMRAMLSSTEHGSVVCRTTWRTRFGAGRWVHRMRAEVVMTQ